eukprot:TRINITY_DN3142_c0_g1_i1.p1 TRINITY_DN3142_c0_g1~~TRINITY_DN3142_c0_g1_i1.p1  ORF type:complete len:242 (+),score=51.21 TRINITY_DN3142_c0_g1_i1:116-841(+)
MQSNRGLLVIALCLQAALTTKISTEKVQKSSKAENCKMWLNDLQQTTPCDPGFKYVDHQCPEDGSGCSKATCCERLESFSEKPPSLQQELQHDAEEQEDSAEAYPPEVQEGSGSGLGSGQEYSEEAYPPEVQEGSGSGSGSGSASLASVSEEPPSLQKELQHDAEEQEDSEEVYPPNVQEGSGSGLGSGQEYSEEAYPPEVQEGSGSGLGSGQEDSEEAYPPKVQEGTATRARARAQALSR